MAGTVKITDNSKAVKEELERKIQIALKAIGETAEGYAKMNCPVDTGRLRNSLTYAISDYQSEPNKDKKNKPGSKPQDAKPKDYKKHRTPEKNSVYIGTNVEYAEYIEYKSMAHEVGRAHFLRDAATTHSSEYKKIAETILKSK